MSIDLSQFSDVFFEEAEEHLRAMETLLLACDVSNPDAEDLNAIFRAAHSIKGGAGAFGFVELTGVTHVLETLLDRIRKKELPLRAAMVDAFLRATDLLAVMLAAYRSAEALPEQSIEETKRSLERLSQGEGAHDGDVVTPVSEPVAAPAEHHGDAHPLAEDLDDAYRETSPAVTPPPGCLHVRIAAGAPIDDAGVMSCLASYGQVLEHHPGSCDRPWRYLCETSRDAADIHGTLTFLIDPDRLTIDQAATEEGAMPPEWEEEHDGYGFFVPVPPIDDGKAAREVDARAEPTREEAGNARAATGHPETEAIAPAGDPPAASADAPARASLSSPRSRHAGDAAGGDGAAKRNGAGGSSIRVSVEKVDQLLNLVGELVITQSMLAQAATELDANQRERLIGGIGQLERNSRELQEAVMSIRMLPISAVFNRFPRVVRDLAMQLGKQVDLQMIGEHTELDKGFIEKLADPMMHLVRNSVDHGIEAPQARVRGGKPATGRLTLRASQQGSDIAIEVIDDGGGLKRERILEKARESGLPVSEAMTDREVWMLIFEPGFSTAAAVTDVSGRGVGMDVVRRNIQAMGGRIDVDSTPGVGTAISIRLPLTLAILDGMSVRIGGSRYIVPLAFITEAVMPADTDIRTVQGSGRVVNVRGEYLPLRSLADLFETGQDTTDGSLALILACDSQKVALLVDELLGQHQVVIKNLETNYRRVRGAAGATIMGDGRVALILDVMSLVMSARNSANVSEMECV
ncbi:chemotaxis protein CheW [Burkholderia thailandensis]|uniref:chemotaxis protein CheW n=1 Tax=Burkholderia thailandensis TaxID=57975 RepID=UPI0005F1F450|nr:chemotaxis protein CheW [Burkholderia thailandensis]AOJ58773.1 chemotaxis protein CheA [Burkholderia thailandensis]KXF57892.1 chemotaxis protein CheA [Burkholderia thailandensis]PNE77360.1 chemotaxis protein CheA [Burkholderia thailandensis]